jgi:hypothetical protein
MASVAGAWRPPFGGATEPAEPPEPTEPPGPAEPPEPTEPPGAAEAVLEPRSPVRRESEAGASFPGTPPPGGYRPPRPVPWAVVTGGPGLASATLPAVVGRGGPIDAPIRDLEASAAPDTVGAARFVGIAGWFVVVGSAMAVLGFLLPWSRVVIGARAFGGYFDAWGLASPTHVIVLAATLIVLALAVVRTPVPAWLRSGVLGLGLGSLLVGLTWPYVVGPLGADVGVIVVALGALALVSGGIVASWATRHAEAEPVV